MIMINIKDTQPRISNSVVHHISAFLILYHLYQSLLCVPMHAKLDFCSFLNFNTIMLASVIHVFDKVWTNLTCHNSTILLYYHYHYSQLLYITMIGISQLSLSSIYSVLQIGTRRHRRRFSINIRSILIGNLFSKPNVCTVYQGLLMKDWLKK